jgi:hypothetical protein
MTQEVFVSTFIYPQNPENPTPNPSPSGYAFGTLRVRPWRAQSAYASRLRRETPSGSPVACGGKPSFSTGLTACSAGLAASEEGNFGVASHWGGVGCCD